MLNYDNWNVISFAASKNNIEVLKFFHKKGFNMNPRDNLVYNHKNS